MPAGLPPRSTAAQQRSVLHGSDLLSVPAAHKELAATACAPGRLEEVWPSWAMNGRRHSTPSPSLGSGDSLSRCLSTTSNVSRISDGSPYIHNPYSFGGPTQLLPCLCLDGSLLIAPSCGETTTLGCYVSDLHIPRSPTQRPSRRPSEPPALPVAPGLLPLPLLPAPTVPMEAGPGQAAISRPHAPVDGHCPCATCSSAPFSPDCEHPRPWRRLRAKRGFTFYACRDCGTKWRAITPSRAMALEAERDP
eukprot:EG_transcript_13519